VECDRHDHQQLEVNECPLAQPVQPGQEHSSQHGVETFGVQHPQGSHQDEFHVRQSPRKHSDQDGQNVDLSLPHALDGVDQSEVQEGWGHNVLLENSAVE